MLTRLLKALGSQRKPRMWHEWDQAFMASAHPPVNAHGSDALNEWLLRNVLPVLMAFASGVLITLCVQGPTQRNSEEAEQLVNELHQARQEAAYLDRLNSIYVDTCHQAPQVASPTNR